ncbi:type III secretion system cytoplasmic ring protein SctQ [Belnapia sp. T18]|uniref:Type III secretion system cytoplasmic ring protein SctQ n=1 Tax=Belnapia arida TaxID=2804533 RepID=A0ABS1U8I8_9PROT|nr:type III secretion system cytoplasmic ring protein SctQ [Belnapia arida]MBL6080032.1 type III secretion system cytoplasmic ring protein SctQ [Belnapia arida]
MPQDSSLLAALPAYTAAGAEASSTVARHLPARLALGGQPLVAALGGPDWRGAPAGWLRVLADFGGHSVLAMMDPAILPQASGRWAHLAPIGLPPALRPVLLGVVLGEATDLAERWSGLRPAWREDDGAGDRPHVLLLARETGGEPVGSLSLDDGALAWVASRMDRAGPPRLLDLAALPVELALVVARLSLSVAELSALSAGDVVLIEAELTDGEGGLATVIRPVGHAGLLRGRLLGGRLEVNAWIDGRLNMPDDATPRGLPPPSLEDLPMTVECEVGRLTLPLSRLRELAPGQVLDLGFDATMRVSLRVNGQVIGTGELVRIAERTGVRVTELRLARDG